MELLVWSAVVLIVGLICGFVFGRGRKTSKFSNEELHEIDLGQETLRSERRQ